MMQDYFSICQEAEMQKRNNVWTGSSNPSMQHVFLGTRQSAYACWPFIKLRLQAPYQSFTETMRST